MFGPRFANVLKRSFSNAAKQSQGGIESKYAEKLRQKLKDEGVASVAEFHRKRQKDDKVTLNQTDSTIKTTQPRFTNKARLESAHQSPIKPLQQIMDLSKIMHTPHTPEQVASIWNGYHSTKGDGTGRGYLSASIPASSFSLLIETAKLFPWFVIPLERTSPDDQNTGHEFFFLEWSFHRANDNNEQAVVMFTPLQEYKLRQQFSQPYLVMTCYSDLIRTHQIGLMRGEISNSPNRPGDFLLSQNDAQLLAVRLQKFYLAKEGQASRKILETFHQNKAEFRWEELLHA